MYNTVYKLNLKHDPSVNHVSTRLAIISNWKEEARSLAAACIPLARLYRVEEYFYFHRAALAPLRGAALLMRPPRRVYAAADFTSRHASCRPYSRTRRTDAYVRALPRRSDHRIFYPKVCTRKYLCLKIPLSQNTLAMLNPLNTTCPKRGPAIMSCVSLYSISERLLIDSKMIRCEIEHF